MNMGSDPFFAWRVTVVAGLVLGVVYALSPLTMWFGVAMIFVVRWAVKQIDGDERRWVMTLLLAAIATRLLVVAALFASTNHAQVPFRSLFGDEEYFIRRSLWLRNVALGIPIHGADLIYAFDEYSETSYLYVLAFLQILVGPAPYGVHLVGIAFYLTASVMMFRLVRTTLGRMPALVGFGLLLFLPSLFAWSISALKDPLYFLLTATTVVLAVKLARGPGRIARVGAMVGLVGIGAALQTVRFAGAALCAASVLGGLALVALVKRPRLAVAVVVALPIVAGGILHRPEAQLKAYSAVQSAARQHWGHIWTAGYVYQTLDARFYPERSDISDMRFDEMLRFLIRSVERYVTVPLPWEARSPSALAYLPEQVVWYVLVALVPVGVVFAFRRDVLVAGLLVANALVAAITVALISGNIGTLVRHRGLALPYLVWLSGVGACELLSRLEGEPE